MRQNVFGKQTHQPPGQTHEIVGWVAGMNYFKI